MIITIFKLLLKSVYKDIFMNIEKDGLIVTAEKAGDVVFSGASKVEINADKIELSGFQFTGGDIGKDDIISITGSDVLITQINIKDYTSYKYLIVDKESRRTTISYCNFENRINRADQNILSILVDDEPGYHKIQYCSFKNFSGTGGDMGVEPIRIGVSTQAHLDSRTIVEYCYFENCDGDSEIISNKAAQNVIRYNTFIDNKKGELVLRHGDEAIVYGNFFLNNKGGIRIREGQNHFIYNNYFSGLTGRAINLQNDPSDPLDSIHFYFNTVVDSKEILLGGNGDHPPQHVVFANNIFAKPKDVLFDDPTGNEKWMGNIYWGKPGIDTVYGLKNLDPCLMENSHGYFQLNKKSPAIDAAISGFPAIPQIEGLDFDDLELDIMKQTRPDAIPQQDIGASEFPNTVNVQPHATQFNTGPAYIDHETK
ncbi:Chondroitinase B [Salegentibacter echinorum]|uniref:Chondroitinase B n=1 Tax=Salegentibacter echinorum TaxID=1073325 RepID=A0A1M5KFB4_SALEC|nr:polysaccharide lyase 6 family protein [Salegentibacter echinorum]SHG51405.1 Chondroitinase B [Salegentibacter echinorum]